ncbi:MAG TPA: hypothetical protein VMZ92_14710 [Planctomycetota bacterium]|nr:hypothetical protein [Planctomycetota bacterium]
MRKYIVLLAVVLLPVAGAFAGRLAGPVLARTHYTVYLADRIRLETADPTLERTLESTAFRTQGGRRDDLYAAASAVERRFVIGGSALGVWCGLVFALAVFGFNRTRRREIYEINYDACLACARCFRTCPRERAGPTQPPDEEDAA